jgi:hypothetical protein
LLGQLRLKLAGFFSSNRLILFIEQLEQPISLEILLSDLPASTSFDTASLSIRLGLGIFVLRFLKGYGICLRQFLWVRLNPRAGKGEMKV